MTVSVPSERQVYEEAAQVLLDHLSPAKVVRFWAAWQIGAGDYLALREQLFGRHAVASLFQEIQAYEAEGAAKRKQRR